MDRITLLNDKLEFRNKMEELIKTAESESRKLNTTEEQLFNEYRSKMDEVDAQIAQLDKALEEEKRELDNKTKNTHNIVNMSKINILEEIRNAMANGTNKFTINAADEVRTTSSNTTVVSVGDVVTTSGDNTNTSAGAGTNVVEKQVQGILAPLYTNSVISQLGVRQYVGLPMGDVVIPKLGKSSCGWANEVAEAINGAPAFSGVTLQPKRITAYVDISKKLIAQDTIGVQNAVEADLVRQIQDKIEATIFGAAAGDATKPAGILYSNVLNNATTSIDTFAKLCAAEAAVEGNGVTNAKYLLNPAGKAALRGMAAGGKTQNVFTNNDVDGVPALVTGNLVDSTKKIAVYGDFSRMAFGLWGDVEVVVDPYTVAVNGCIRLIVTAFADFKVLDKSAFGVMNF